jgi:hypothetical protein
MRRRRAVPAAFLCLLPAAIALIELHGPAGQRIFVNPSEVTSIREPHGIDQGHWAKGTRCLVVMADGKFLTVTEACDEVRQKLEAGRGFP